MTGLSISQKGLLEMAAELKRLIEEARVGDNTELLFDLMRCIAPIG